MNVVKKTQPHTVLRSTLAGSATDVLKAEAPSFAIFSLPKPFDDPHIECIQRNAIASWQALGKNVQVILMGDETGIAETAAELGTQHVGLVQRNEYGTPLISDAFEIASASTEAKVLVYCNADVILLHDFRHALVDIMQSDCRDEFLAIGRRMNLSLQQSVDFCDRVAVQKLLEHVDAEGELAPIVCKEYFAFPRDQFDRLPPFAVGRGNWDNWMVADTKRRGVPVVDLSDRVTAIHQNHDYQHIANGRCEGQSVKLRRKFCYLSGAEARDNQRLAKGKHIISGSTASHRLTEQGVVRNRWSGLNFKFWTDLPRFVQLLRKLFLG